MYDDDNDNASTPAIHACPECGGPLQEEAQRYGTGWHDCRGCGWRETLPTDLEEYVQPPEVAVEYLDRIVGALDAPDLLAAEEAENDLEAWVARWLPADTPWDPIVGADDVTVVGVEFYTPAAGTVRLVVRTVTA